MKPAGNCYQGIVGEYKESFILVQNLLKLLLILILFGPIISPAASQDKEEAITAQISTQGGALVKAIEGFAADSGN